MQSGRGVDCTCHYTVRRSQLITLGYFIRLLLTTADACIVVFIGHLSVTEENHAEQCQFTAKGHSWAVWYSMLSPVVVTFIHHKGRPRWISRLEAYANQSPTGCLYVCMSATLTSNISETKGDRGTVTIVSL